MEAVDHRRAVAERNRAAILDATERLLAGHGALSMAAVASEAGLSRPTLYAHFKTLPDVLEAAVERSVESSRVAIEATEPDAGPADEALMRMLEAAWRRLAGFEALARGAAEHLPTAHRHRAHASLIELVTRVVERGQREGTVRADLSAAWLVTAYFALVHAADELARAPRTRRAEVLGMLKTSARDLVRPSDA